MSSEPYIGEIMLFAGTFAPRGWARCDGQLLPIDQNAALFSIVGTTYGGNGVNSFALPDLRGKTAIGVGAEQGGAFVQAGESRRSQRVMVGLGQGVKQKISELDTSLQRALEEIEELRRDTPTEAGHGLHGSPGNPSEYLEPDAQMLALEEGDLGLTYCIALEGTYPPRS